MAGNDQASCASAAWAGSQHSRHFQADVEARKQPVEVVDDRHLLTRSRGRCDQAMANAVREHKRHMRTKRREQLP
eukprot:996369-Prymnesium_polylepis.1